MTHWTNPNFLRLLSRHAVVPGEPHAGLAGPADPTPQGLPLLRRRAAGCSRPPPTHSTFAKACKIAGIAPANIRIIPTAREDLFSLRPDSLRAAMELTRRVALLPAYVCATVGTTSSTAVDPVAGWPRRPAASAPGCTSTRRTRAAPASARVPPPSRRAPTKWLLTGLDCCCLWVRDRARLTTSLSTDPEYLKNRATESGRSSIIRTGRYSPLLPSPLSNSENSRIGTGRRFRALKLFMVMRCYGTANLQSHIGSDVRMARGFEEMVAAEPRFEWSSPGGSLSSASACGRAASAQTARRRRTQRTAASGGGDNSGGIYATHTVIGGMYVIRFAVGTTLTEERHVKVAWELFRDKAEAAWEAMQTIQAEWPKYCSTFSTFTLSRLRIEMKETYFKLRKIN
ncbi:unnamed protein product [Spirodela intermedia]|uniref:Uncharacterized protein n=1 Tax=Spirodela intermedia TaxID=51605 RepID=A0ABN7E872_SPIIN|nr:unnamed protein product [Spirodela intermedia]